MLVEPKGQRDVTLIATGSEVALAVERRQGARRRGDRGRAWCRCPAGSCSTAQDRGLSGRGAGRAPRVGVEAAVEFGWEKWLGPDGAFVGMHGFGASAPAEELYKHFGITAGGRRLPPSIVIGKSQ